MNLQNVDKLRAFVSERVVFDNKIQAAVLIVKNGKIIEIFEGNVTETVLQNYSGILVENFGSMVLMPGIIDSHVHVNEPGRTEWEGFVTATKAAAVGGITTIADMPLNSIPPTTTVDNLKQKANEAKGKIYVDVAFWGGFIPGNENELPRLIDAGVIGFKCFLCPSGVEEFPHVIREDVDKAFKILNSSKSVLAFHAEYDETDGGTLAKGDALRFESFLQSRPSEMEMRAIEMICKWCKKYNVRCHIVHLSTAEALDLIRDIKKYGAPLTVETCYHYLVLSASEIPDGATRFKCCPPIRDKQNQDKLWEGISMGIIDMVVSDHSPCPIELKTCNFFTAWGGISSLQFGLSLLWTAGKSRNVCLTKISELLSSAPAKLCGLEDRKGYISVGMDADFVIWDPEKMIKVEKDQIYFKNKITPYENRLLYGKIEATILRGEFIYKDNRLTEVPIGNLLLKEHFLR